MNKRLLESYQANKRLIERNTKKIEEEQEKDIPAVMGKVTGSTHDFPYIKQRFSVQMSEPVEVAKSSKRIARWQQEITQAEKEIEEVEQFIEEIADIGDREIMEMYYVTGKKQSDIARDVGYTQGRISQIIQKYVKD